MTRSFSDDLESHPPEPRRRFSRLLRIRTRIEHVESVFGDPWAVDNPAGLSAGQAAARGGRLAPMAVQRYGHARLQDEIVPVAFGGSFEGLDQLGLVHRAVFRRDPGLGVHQGFHPFVGALLVLLSGTLQQQSSVFETLLHRGLVGVAYPRFEAGTPAQARELRVEFGPEGLVLSGVKDDITNGHTAEKLLCFARIPPPQDPRPGGAGAPRYSLLLVDPAAAAPPDLRVRDRLTTAGTRGAEMAGLEFRSHPLPPDALVGTWGQAMEYGVRVLPAVHALLPILLVGLADTGLRQAVRHTVAAVPGRAAPAPAVETALAEAFADLLAADALALVAGRAVHVAPAESDVLCAASRYVVPTLLRDLLSDAGPALGDAFHGDAALSRHLGDLGEIAFTGVGLSNALNSIAPFLPSLHDSGADTLPPCDRALFRLDADLDPLDPAGRRAHGGADGLLRYLFDSVRLLPEALAVHDRGQAVLDLVDELVDEVRLLRAACGRLGPDSPAQRYFGLANRYSYVLAATAMIGIWLNSGAGDDPFVGRTDWLTLGLHRMLQRLGRRRAAPEDAVYRAVHEEVLRRVREQYSLDLLATRVAG